MEETPYLGTDKWFCGSASFFIKRNYDEKTVATEKLSVESGGNDKAKELLFSAYEYYRDKGYEFRSFIS